MKALLLLSLPLFSSLPIVDAIALPRNIQSHTSNLKHEMSGLNAGRFLLFKTASAKTGGNNHAQPRYGKYIVPTTSLKHNQNTKPTDLDETHGLGATARLNIDKNHNIHLSTPVQPARDTRYMKPSCSAIKDSMREFSSQVFDTLRRLSASLLSFSKDNSERDMVASHNDKSNRYTAHLKDDLLRPWMIVLWMVWLVPIAIVLVEMAEYAWKWIRGDVNILRTVEDEHQTRFAFANGMEKGTRDMGIRYPQPSNDDEDFDEEFNDLVP